MDILRSAGRTNAMVNRVGRAAVSVGKGVEFAGKVVSGLSSFSGGNEMGTGIIKAGEGKFVEAMADFFSGSTKVAVTLLTVGSGFVVGMAGGAAIGGVGLAADTVRAVQEGRETPVESAVQWHSEWMANTINWVRGDKK